MAIEKPRIRLLRYERRFLEILESYLLQVLEQTALSSPQVHLSNAELNELFSLVQAFGESKRFRESAYLIEALYREKIVASHSSLQRIHATKAGLTSGRNPWARHNWIDFNARAGNAPILPDRPTNTKPMNFEHFLKMEEVLFEELQLETKVSELLLSEVRAQQGEIEHIRNSRKGLPSNLLYKLIESVPESFRKAPTSDFLNKPVETKKAAGILTIVANMSVLYSTRDWSVTGVLSTLAGAAIATVGK